MRRLFKVILLAFLLGTVGFGLGTVQAEIPHLIHYQGKLTDSESNPLEGAYDLTFRIYDAEDGGSLLWDEAQTGVVVQKGLFSVMLGSAVDLNLAFDKSYWLAIKVGTDSEMTPRQRIASVGYAIRAEVAENVVSLPQGIVVMWSGRIQNIPQGWALCDGANGTPNLTDRFVIHADADSGGTNDVGDTGGAHTHTLSVNEMPAHTHSYSVAVMSDGNGNDAGVVVNAGSTTGSTGGGSAHENRPKFYALAYIMKT